MGHIFISYSHKDSSYVHRLAEALKQEGFQVWIDDNIHYGSEWPKVVTRNLDVSDGVIVVLSNNSYESDMVQNEVARAREKNKPIFPLLLDGENWLIVQAKQFVDIRDESLPTEKFYKRLEEITPRRNERAEHEAAEKAEKAAREKLEREDAEKTVRKKSEREAEREKIKLVAAEKAKREKAGRRGARWDVIKKFLPKAMPFLRVIGIFGIIFVLFWMGSQAMSQFVSPLPATKSTVTNIENLKTFTPVFVSQTKPPIFAFTPTNVSLVTQLSLTSTLVFESSKISPVDGMILHYVPAGMFTMGDTAEHAYAECLRSHDPNNPVFLCDQDNFEDEQPIHQVYLDAFWMDETEVTNEQYKRCVKEGSCQMSSPSPYYSDGQHGDYPVVFVAWNDANSYCLWAKRRLPTEAEWEKAARGTDGRTYPWGEEIGTEYANYNTSPGDVTRVGSYELGKSPYNLYDMAGNVSEWVADLYDPEYYKTLEEDVINPQGPSLGYGFVIRGGAFLYNDIQSANRDANDRANRVTNGIGFRCAMNATQ